MVVFGAVAFMLVAGWQVGVSGTEAVFSDTEVALENAIAGSCDKDKYESVCGGVADECKRETFSNGVCIWYKGQW